MALSLGPIINITLFSLYGNDWNMKILSNISLVAMGFGFITAIPFFYLKDI